MNARGRAGRTERIEEKVEEKEEKEEEEEEVNERACVIRQYISGMHLRKWACARTSVALEVLGLRHLSAVFPSNSSLLSSIHLQLLFTKYLQVRTYCRFD
jgi:hypothetical protein